MKEIMKKALLLISSSVLLSGSITPVFTASAETVDSQEVEENNMESTENQNEDVENKASEEVEDIEGLNEEEETIGENVQQNSEKESDEEESEIDGNETSEDVDTDESNTDTQENDEVGLFFEIDKDNFDTIDTSFQDFLNAFEELSEKEAVDNIDEFQLFIDDENKIHSTYEEFFPGELGANQNEGLIELLRHIRFSDEYTTEDPYIFDEDPTEMFQSPASAQSVQETTVERIGGGDRVDVSINVSKRGWNQSDTVVIVNGFKFTDALSGTPLAAHYNAPMLLVDGSTIKQTMLNEINRLGASNVIILGGTASVSNQISNNLESNDLSVRRIAGNNRYDTSRMIADELISLRGASTAHLVNGDAYADAVSISSVAGRYKQPIVLTRSNQLHPEAARIANQVKDWRIIGGTASVSSNTENQLNRMVNNTTRLSGQNRYEVNKRVLNHWGISGSKVYVGHGTAFADILAGSVMASRENTGVLLVSENNSDISTAQEYSRNRNLNHFILLGGENTLGSKIVDAFRNLEQKLVYIDPGHGGSDSGATYNGVREKDLNMQIARRLRDQLNATGHYNVVMSRDGEEYLTLAQRANDANNQNADIFISIHHNAMGGVNAGQARGIETFVHHPTYPGQVPRSQLRTNIPRIRESAALADRVHAQVINRTGLRNRGVKGLNLGVLRQTNMPAALVEYGFMDNPNDLSIIRQTQFQSNAASATKDGINQYFGF